MRYRPLKKHLFCSYYYIILPKTIIFNIFEDDDDDSDDFVFTNISILITVECGETVSVVFHSVINIGVSPSSLTHQTILSLLPCLFVHSCWSMCYILWHTYHCEHNPSGWPGRSRATCHHDTQTNAGTSRTWIKQKAYMGFHYAAAIMMETRQVCCNNDFFQSGSSVCGYMWICVCIMSKYPH